MHNESLHCIGTSKKIIEETYLFDLVSPIDIDRLLRLAAQSNRL